MAKDHSIEVHPEGAKTFTIEVQSDKLAREFANVYGQTNVAFVTVTKIMNVLQRELNIPVMSSGMDTFTIDLSKIPAAQGETAQKAWERVVKQNFPMKKTGFRFVETAARKSS